MALITLPQTLRFGAGCGLGQQRFDLVGSSEATGSEQVRLMAPPRWTLALRQPDKLSLREAGLWQALLVQLRGRVNTLAAWDVHRPAPLGTLRGTPVLSAAAAAGAVQVVLSATAGATLLAGDWIQIGSGVGTSQLVMCTADATADGAGLLTVTFEAPLRIDFAAGAGVRWDKALGYFRTRSDASVWTYSGGGMLASGMALDMMETWQP